MESRLIGLLVHLFTASGAGLGLVALFLAVEARFAEMFAWLGAAFFVDAVDGWLARRFNVVETAPSIDGVALDLVVDFLTYTIAPLVALWRAALLPPALAASVCAIISAASALYFADRRMKTHDFWFRGFPATWNLLVFYLLVFRPESYLALVIVLGAGALMFSPVVFVHPMRVRRLRSVTVAATAIWGVAAIVAVAQNLADAAPTTKAALLATALYFLALPLFRGDGATARDNLGERDG